MAADLAALERLAARIWQERDDLRQRFGSIADMGYWMWLMLRGVREHAEIRDLLPIPGPELRKRVSNADEEAFLRSGAFDAGELFERLERAGFDLRAGGRVLDFGCGCGRILRIAARIRETCELHGADVDAVSIDWCRENLGFASFELIAPRPPSPYPDGAFDAIYSYSIFSHLPEALHRSWLEDLQRILRPGGCLVVTTHGRRVVERFASGDVDPTLQWPTAEEMRADRRRFEAGGYLYFSFPFPSPLLSEADRAEDLYGMAFFDERYVREHWLDLFELVSFDPAPQDWQDYVVLRRRD